MITYVLLLRGVNLGSTNKMKMADLTTLLADNGYGRVRTILNSGNVILDAPEQDMRDLTAALEDLVEGRFGFRSIMLRTLKQIRALVAADPFHEVAGIDGARFYATFLGEGTVLPDPDSLPEHEQLNIVRVTPSEICAAILPAAGATTPDLMAVLGRVSGKNITTRNWNTVLKIAALD